MPKKLICALIVILSVLYLPFFIFAQEEGEDNGGAEAAQEGSDEPLFDFGLDLAIGVQTFDNPDFNPADPLSPENITYQSLSLRPDISIGKFGLGLDLTLNYRFTGGPDNNSFEIRGEDWIPAEAGLNFLELYLPKFRYVRWAEKGDNLYIRLGQIDNGLLGNGFIVGNYTNTLFLPDRRIFGLVFDLDGKLFEFPYIGIETMVANLAAIDLFGARLFVRPLNFLEVPVIKELQIGGTVAMDRRPYYHAVIDDPDISSEPADARVLIGGADFRLPILSNDIISLAAFGDIVFQNTSTGGMLGFGGRLFGFLLYGAQGRILGENFVPVYFDQMYDMYRLERYQIFTGSEYKPAYVGWLANLGFAFLDDALVFQAIMEGPFTPGPNNLPSLRAFFTLAEGLIPNISLSAFYIKNNIAAFSDLISPEDALIGARINYKTGPAVLSFVYSLSYNPYVAPGEDPWEISSGLESSISIF